MKLDALPLAAISLLLLTSPACIFGGKDTTDPGDESDADTDADSDADSDADTDADTDTDVEPTRECDQTESACDEGGCTWDVAAEVFQVTGAVTYNGERPPTYDGYDDFTVYFTDTESGRQYDFGGDRGDYAAAVPRGTYDISLVLLNLGAEGICYDEILVEEEEFIDGDATIDVNAEVFAVTGEVTYNGERPPVYEGYDDFTVYFTDTESGRQYDFGGDRGAYAAAVPGGTYDISLVLLNLGTEGFCYDEILVREDKSISEDSTVAVEAEVFAVDGEVTYNGDSPPSYEGYDDFTVYFTDTESGRQYDFGGDRGRYDAAVPGGTYDISLVLLNLGTEGICYDEILVREDKSITADSTVAVAAEVFTVNGDVTYNGEAPTSYEGYDDFTVYFTDTESGRRYDFGGDRGEYQAAVPGGTYDISIVLLNLGAEGVNYDELLVREDKVIDEDRTVGLDALVFAIEGEVTYNGEPPPFYEGYDDFTVYFTDTESGRRYDFGGDRGAYAADVPGGTYDISIVLLNLGTEGICYDEILVRDDKLVDEDRTIGLDAVVFDVSGEVTYNGERPPVYEGYDDFTVYFTDIATGGQFDFGGDQGTYAAALPGGIYDVSFVLLNLGEEGICYDVIVVGECVEIG